MTQLVGFNNGNIPAYVSNYNAVCSQNSYSNPTVVTYPYLYADANGNQATGSAPPIVCQPSGSYSTLVPDITNAPSGVPISDIVLSGTQISKFAKAPYPASIGVSFDAGTQDLVCQASGYSGAVPFAATYSSLNVGANVTFNLNGAFAQQHYDSYTTGLLTSVTCYHN